MTFKYKTQTDSVLLMPLFYISTHLPLWLSVPQIQNIPPVENDQGWKDADIQELRKGRPD